MGMPPTASGSLAPSVYVDNRIPSSPLHYSSGPLPLSEIPTAPQPKTAAVPVKRGRLFYTSLALLVLLLVALAAGAGYFYLRASSGVNADASIAQARALITTAQGEVAAQPASALNHLAIAQRQLHALPQGSLSSEQVDQETGF
jgi:uncharacterized protein HemX